MKDSIITVVFVVIIVTVIGAWSIWIMPVAIGVLIGIELFSWIGAIIIGGICGIADIRREDIKTKEEKQREEWQNEFMRMLEKKDK